MAEQRPRLAIVGASARAAAFSAIRGGFDVVTADLFADADLKRVVPEATRIDRYPEGLVDWLAATECDAWLYTGALENRPQLVDAMAELRPLIGNRGDALWRVRDPLVLQDACVAARAPFPATRDSAAGLPHDGSWLCKTYAGASGSGVWRLDGPAALARAKRERAVFQKLVPGEPAAAVFVVSDLGAELVGVTRQLVGEDDEHPWRYDGSIGPIAVSAPCTSTLERVGGMLRGAFGQRGVVGVDVLISGDDAWVVEVNPRYTASMEILERANGRSMVAAAAAAACGFDSPTELQRSGGGALVHGKQIVYASRSARILPSFVVWADALPPLGQFPVLADVPDVGVSVGDGQPIATVFAAERSVEACRERLAAMARELKGRAFGIFEGER